MKHKRGKRLVPIIYLQANDYVGYNHVSYLPSAHLVHSLFTKYHRNFCSTWPGHYNFLAGQWLYGVGRDSGGFVADVSDVSASGGKEV